MGISSQNLNEFIGLLLSFKLKVLRYFEQNRTKVVIVLAMSRHIDYNDNNNLTKYSKTEFCFKPLFGLRVLKIRLFPLKTPNYI